MPKISSQLTGSAGEHFVAYQLSCLGFVVGLPRGGSPAVDLIISNYDGSKAVNIQVKTTDFAKRWKGRKGSKVLDRYEFPLSRNLAKSYSNSLFYAFVDLNSLDNLEIQPDVFIVESKFIYDWCEGWVDNVSMVRFHIQIDKLNPFKNNYSPVINALKISQ